ncbi:MAG: hypothetical protein IJP21_00545 [Clostridia bacterium]|nr:hypothetical protein [Clostridia bacterium]
MFNSSSKLRIFFIAVFFILGIGLVWYGWSLTGQMGGLLLMILGVVLLLSAILIYNKPYGKTKERKDK